MWKKYFKWLLKLPFFGVMIGYQEHFGRAIASVSDKLSTNPVLLFYFIA